MLVLVVGAVTVVVAMEVDAAVVVVMNVVVGAVVAVAADVAVNAAASVVAVGASVEMATVVAIVEMVAVLAAVAASVGRLLGGEAGAVATTTVPVQVVHHFSPLHMLLPPVPSAQDMATEETGSPS